MPLSFFLEGLVCEEAEADGTGTWTWFDEWTETEGCTEGILAGTGTGDESAVADGFVVDWADTGRDVSLLDLTGLIERSLIEEATAASFMGLEASGTLMIDDWMEGAPSVVT